MALPQRHRLRGQRLFDALYRRGTTVHGSAMVLRWLVADPELLPAREPLPPPSPWRCGVVVSTKVHKRAVQRNRLRRQLHDCLCHAAFRPERPSLWLMFSLKPGSAEWERDRLLGECRHLLSKAGLVS